MRRPKMWERDRSSWFTPQWAPTSSTTQLSPSPPTFRLFWMTSKMKPLGRYGYISEMARCRLRLYAPLPSIRTISLKNRVVRGMSEMVRKKLVLAA